jgi:hypothetical protein
VLLQLLPWWHCGVVAAITAMALMHCWCRGVAIATRYGVAAEIFVFFLLDNFKRENESEKEKKERNSKPVSQLYWLA